MMYQSLAYTPDPEARLILSSDDEKRWKSTSLNWDIDMVGAKSIPLLKSRDAIQIDFLLKPDLNVKKEDDPASERVVFGQLSLGWRSSCRTKYTRFETRKRWHV